MLGLAVIHTLNERRTFEPLWQESPDWAYALGLGLAIPFILAVVPAAAAPFIYFQF